jgi:hypothetical protein
MPFGPAHRDAGAVLYIRRHDLAQNPWFAAHLIHLEHDPVSPPLRFNHRGAVRAVERKGHRDDALQRVALLAARG